MLDFFFRHYEPWIDRFYFFDDGSTDGTLETLSARSDVVVERTPRIDPTSFVRSARHIYNSDWKRSIGEADWVVVTNLDEHLYHPRMREHLEEMLAAGVTVVPAPGYQMISEDYPAPGSLLWRDIPFGAPWAMYSRIAIFRPDQIRRTNYTAGRHRVHLEGNVVLPERDEVANLHFKYLGLTETKQRHDAQQARLGETDLLNGWGRQYGWNESQLATHFEGFKSKLTNVIEITSHSDDLRWWRTD
jgi:hypothetical protein